MKISVDGGGLCALENQRFGNYVFSTNLINALLKYDLKKRYYVYSFCEKPANLNPSEQSFYKLLKPRCFFMKGRVSFEEIINRKDIFLGLNQALPLFTRAKIISFSHGLSFMYFPQFYKTDFNRLHKQFNEIYHRSHMIVVSSIRVKEQLLQFKCRLKIAVIPYGIPNDMIMASSESTRLPRSCRGERSFLFVGMNHPIKNIEFIVRAFQKFRENKKYQKYKLYLIGNHGLPYNKNVIVKKKVARKELANLYKKSVGYLTASHYESFNLPVLEALSLKCPVIGLESAIIPELADYVFRARNLKEFVDQMILVAEGKRVSYDQAKLVEFFSWKKYVRELVKLYR